jgi:hypothetical protein
MTALKVYGETRTCSGCHVAKALAMFTPFHDPTGRVRLKPRCKTCVAHAQQERRWRLGQVVPRKPRSDTKVCRVCGHELPVSAFERQRRGDGTGFERAQCKACVNQRKRALRAATMRPPRPKPPARIAKPKPAPKPKAPPPELHPCIGCGVGLSTTTECIPCKRKRQAKNHVGSDARIRERMRKSVLNRFSRGLYAGLLWLRDGDVWGLDYLCQGRNCDQPVLVPSKCWSCATGRPRVLRRADGTHVPLPRVEVRDQPVTQEVAA